MVSDFTRRHVLYRSMQVGLCYLPIPRRPLHGITVVIGNPIAFESREACDGGLEGKEGAGGKGEGLVAAAERFQVRAVCWMV